MYGNLVAAVDDAAADSVHLTGWPTDELAGFRDEDLERVMAIVRRTVELARTLRGSAGLRVRQPIARLWLAVPTADRDGLEPLLELVADEVNVKSIELIGDESDLVDRKVKPLLPVIGKKLGSAIPAVMTAAREGRVEIHPDGSVTLGGVTLAPDEVEIQATPRPGTAVASDDGLVVVIDTELTPELRAEGDARELQRAVQDLRRDAELALDGHIELWLDPVPATLEPHLATVAAETLADVVHRAQPPADVVHSSVELESGTARIGLRATDGGSS